MVAKAKRRAPAYVTDTYLQAVRSRGGWHCPSASFQVGITQSA